MKRVIALSVALIAIISLSAMVFAQETKDDTRKRAQEQMQKVRQARPKSASIRSFRGSRVPGSRSGAPVRPQRSQGMIHQQQIKSLQGQILRKKQALQQQKAELDAIKQIATSEGATKTVAYIDKLIAQKTAELVAETQKVEDKMKAIKDQIKKQIKQRSDKQKRPTKAVKDK